MRLAGNTEVCHQTVEELGSGQMRIKNECRSRTVLAKPIQHHVEQSSLARAHFAGQQNDAPPAAYPISQTGQCFLNPRCQEQIPRVRIDLKRAFSQTKKLLIHFSLSTTKQSNSVRAAFCHFPSSEPSSHFRCGRSPPGFALPIKSRRPGEFARIYRVPPKDE